MEFNLQLKGNVLVVINTWSGKVSVYENGELKVEFAVARPRWLPWLSNFKFNWPK